MKYIPKYEKRYRISKGGYIENRYHKEMKQSTNPQGYKMVSLTAKDGSRKTHRIHRLVAFTYLPAPIGDQDQVNHIDGDKANNTVQNLEWCNQWDNMDHAKRMGFIKCGDDRSDKQKTQAVINGRKQGKRNRKITPAIATKMQELYDSGQTLTQVANTMGYGFTSVQRHVENIRSEAGRFKTKEVT